MTDKLDKQALAQPLSPETAKEWAGKGMFQSPSAAEEMPKGHTQGEYGQIMEETGAGALFGADVPKLRKFYMPEVKNIVMIDDKEYLLTHIEKSGNQGRGKNKVWVDGHIEVFGPIVRKQNKAIDWKQTPTQPVQLSYDKYAEQIKRSPEVMQEKLSLINDFIEDHNTFVDKQKDKSFGTVTVLPLQIDRAKRMVDKRLQEIENIQKNTELSEKKDAKLDKAKQDLSKLREDVMTGKTATTPANYAVAVLETKFHSVQTLQELQKEIAGLQLPFDPQVSAVIKSYLSKVVEWQIGKRQQAELKKKDESTQREERKEEDLSEMKELLLKKIQPIQTLPGQYEKAKGFYGPEFVGTQAHEIEESTTTDYDELVEVKHALDDAMQTIIDLPKASNEYLMANGGIRLNKIQKFIGRAEIFVKRYKKPVFVPSTVDPETVEINPNLFSKSSVGLGNALIAVVLNQVILGVNGELDRIRGGKIGEGQPPAKAPAKVLAPVSSKHQFIQKLASALWQAFEYRFKGK